MSKFCGDCGSQTTEGNCGACTSKSIGGVNVEALEKALGDLESMAKGVRPSEAKKPKVDVRDLEEATEAARKQVHKYGEHGEGDSEEEPKTKKGVEEAAKGGFMPPPPEDEGEDEEEREREEEERERQPQAPPMPFKSTKGKAKKSIGEELMEDDNVRKAVDVSPFLEGLTAQIVDGYDSLSADVAKSMSGWSYQQKYNVGLAKALGELGNLVKGLTEVVATLSKSPAGQRKGDVTVVEKSFNNGSNPIDGEAAPTMSKSEIAGRILKLKESGDTSIEEIDILRAESTGLVRPEVQKKLGL